MAPIGLSTRSKSQVSVAVVVPVSPQAWNIRSCLKYQMVGHPTSLSTVMSQSQEHVRIVRSWDMIHTNSLKVPSLLVSVWEQRRHTFTSEVNSGMNKCNYKKQSMRPTRRVSSERMLVEVDMTLTYMYKAVLAPIFVVKNQLWLRASRASQVDPDWSLPSQLMPVSTVVLLLWQTSKQSLLSLQLWDVEHLGSQVSVVTRTREQSCSVSVVMSIIPLLLKKRCPFHWKNSLRDIAVVLLEDGITWKPLFQEVHLYLCWQRESVLMF